MLSSRINTVSAQGVLPASPLTHAPANNHGKFLFKGYTVTTLDRNHCSAEEEAKLVALINNAYKFKRVTLADKTSPTARYYCLKDGEKLLACAGYAPGDEAETDVPEGLTRSDCYISPFAAVRGRGYGKELLQRIVQVAREEGFSTLTFHVWNDAPLDMNPYYQGIGYVRGETFKYLYNRKETSTTRYHQALSV